MTLIWTFILIYLLRYILTEKKSNNNRNLKSIQRIDIILELYDIKCKVINIRYLPNSVYINGIKAQLDRYGFIDISQYGLYNITLEWERKIDNYSFLFENIDRAIEITFTNFDISGTKSLSGMFLNCYSLKKINFNNFNTSSVEDMSSMFENCYSLTSLDLSNFDTKNVISMRSMFKSCLSLTSLNISNFITPKLTIIINMFFECYSLEFLDISNINTSLVLYMNEIFIFCQSLKELDLSNFDTENAISMNEMFKNCIVLISLDLSNFVTSKVKNMSNMFEGCSSLQKLNLSNFNTSNVEYMDYMFIRCFELTSLDLSNFDTSKVISMNYMFSMCKSLASLNISNFDTSKVTSMKYMFSNCEMLTSIDLSNFDTSEVISMSYMFSESRRLSSLNLSNFDISQKDLDYMFNFCESLKSITFSKDYKLITKIEGMFKSCTSLISINLYNFDFGFCNSMYELFNSCSSLTSLDLSEIDSLLITDMGFTFGGCISLKILIISNWKTLSLTNINYMFSNCQSLTSLDISNFDTSLVTNMQGLFYNCYNLLSINLSNFNTSLTIYMGVMFYNCTSLLSIDISNFNTSLVEDMSTMFFACSNLTTLDLSHFSLNSLSFLYGMLAGCESLEYINIYNFSIKNDIYFVQMFSKVTENIAICLNMNGSKAMNLLSELKLKKCPIIDCSANWREHKYRLIEKKGVCIDKCYNDNIYKYEFKFHCYDKCPKGTFPFFLKDNEYNCETKVNECFANYPFISLIDNSCLEECNSENFFNNLCTLNNISSYNITQKNIIATIINEIQDGSLDNLLIEVLNNQKDLIKLEKDILYQITSSFNQDNKEYKNISTIHLGECEKILKEKNNIPEDKNLIIFKIEKYIDGILIPLIQYTAFNPISKERIDLSYCINLGINIYLNIPISINEKFLMKYNPNIDYYKDICYTYTTDFGTDINLYDRQNEFNHYYSVCPNNCIFSAFNLNKSQAICNCKIRDGIFLDLQYKNNELIYLINLMNSRNIDILKCYKLLFSIKGLIKNIGNYIILFIIIIYIVLAIIFYLKEYISICEQINDLLRAKFIEFYCPPIKDEIKENSTDIFSSSKTSKISDIKNHLDKSIIEKKNDSIISVNCNGFANETQNIKKIEKIPDNLDYEFNSLSYDEALEIDKRTFFKFYISLLKTNHILLYTFTNKKEYNSFAIKIGLLFFYLALNLVLNSLFFNDSAIHQIYIDKGNFNFIYFLPQIIYSIIVSDLLFSIVKRLSLTQQNIIKIKKEKNKFNFNVKASSELKYVNIKFKIFFAFSLIFLVIFWYYLSSFCAVYKNTQIYLIKTTIISYLLAFINPIFTYLLAGYIRFFSLKNPEENFYKLSKFIQLY